MPTPIRTWTCDQNNVPADQTSVGAQTKEALLTFKNALKTAGWTVAQSSDSSTADTSDNWSATSDIVFGTSAHSWIVLKSPANYPSTGNFIYFGIDCYNSGDIHVDFCTATAEWGSLTTSVGPAHSSATHANGDNKWTDATMGTLVPSSVENIKYHICTNTTGDWIFYTSVDSTGLIHFGSFMNKLTGADSGDSYPVATYFDSMGSSTSSSFSANGYYYTNMRASGSSARTKGFIGASVGGLTVGEAIDSYQYWQQSHMGIESYWTQMTDASGNDVTGKFPALPFLVIGNSTTYRQVRGYLTDIYASTLNQSGSQISSSAGDVQPGTGTITMGNIGSLWVPSSEAPNLT